MHSNISSARRHVEALRSALLSAAADPIDECLPGLTEAAACLRKVEQRLRAEGGDHPELRSDLNALKSDLRVVAKLIEHGAAFYSGWARLLGAATRGYLPSGEAAPLDPARTVSVQA